MSNYIVFVNQSYFEYEVNSEWYYSIHYHSIPVIEQQSNTPKSKSTTKSPSLTKKIVTTAFLRQPSKKTLHWYWSFQMSFTTCLINDLNVKKTEILKFTDYLNLKLLQKSFCLSKDFLKFSCLLLEFGLISSSKKSKIFWKVQKTQTKRSWLHRSCII